MKFRLTTAASLYQEKEIEKNKNMDSLKNLGFTFRELENLRNTYVILGEPEIEFTTLEELLSFCKDWGGSIIVDFVVDDGIKNITIYNDYVE